MSPMFGKSHFSNPAVGRFHSGGGGGDREESTLTHGKSQGAGAVEKGGHHSVHGYFHDDGSAHTHVHHADGTHEHMDHATHDEAADHMKAALDGAGGGDQEPDMGDFSEEEKPETPRMTVHGATRAGGGAF